MILYLSPDQVHRMTDKKARLYLIPTPISSSGVWSFSTDSIDAIRSCSTLVCERIRTTRRHIKQYFDQESFDQLNWIEINKHDAVAYVKDGLRNLSGGEHVAVLSEAGMPCIADPGYHLVLAAHQQNIEVVPLVGPCSFIMALTASGLNGQAFTFHGYLPREQEQLHLALKNIEQSAKQTGMSQLFMETPYRNQKLFETILAKVSEQLYLNIALDITGSNQVIITKSISAWKKKRMTFEEKHPAVFILGTGNNK